MNNDCRQCLPDQLRALQRFHDFASRLNYLSVVAKASIPDISASVARKSRPQKSKPDSAESSFAPSAAPFVDWWKKVRLFLVSVTAYTKPGEQWEGKVAEPSTFRVYQALRRAEGIESPLQPSLLESIAGMSSYRSITTERTADGRLRQAGPSIAVLDVASKFSRRVAAFSATARDAAKTFVTNALNYVDLAVASLAIALVSAFEKPALSELLRRVKPHSYLDVLSASASLGHPLNRAVTAFATRTSIQRDGYPRSTPFGGLHQRLTTLQSATAIATLATPLVGAPALAAVPSLQRGAEPMNGPSIVINSTPTVIVNSNQGSEIESLVLRALTQHREALYEQWHREVRRRQRTEL